MAPPGRSGRAQTPLPGAILRPRARVALAGLCFPKTSAQCGHLLSWGAASRAPSARRRAHTATGPWASRCPPWLPWPLLSRKGTWCARRWEGGVAPVRHRWAGATAESCALTSVCTHVRVLGSVCTRVCAQKCARVSVCSGVCARVSVCSEVCVCTGPSPSARRGDLLCAADPVCRCVCQCCGRVGGRECASLQPQVWPTPSPPSSWGSAWLKCRSL